MKITRRPSRTRDTRSGTASALNDGARGAAAREGELRHHQNAMPMESAMATAAIAPRRVMTDIVPEHEGPRGKCEALDDSSGFRTLDGSSFERSANEHRE